MVLDIRNVQVSLGATQIVHDVELSVAAGELVMLLGPNGAGKSTLLKAVSGDAPARGEILVSGQALTDWCPQALSRHRGVMPQRVDINFPLTAEEVVRLGLSAKSPGRADELVEHLLSELEISHLRHRLVPGLSGGEQQRLQLARVLAQIADTEGERLLLLDECTSALDPAHQQVVLQRVQRLAREQGVAVLAVVHDLNLAAQYADRLVMMRAGRCVLEGSAREVLTPEVLDAVYGFQARIVELPEGYPLVVPLGQTRAQTAPLKPVCRQAS